MSKWTRFLFCADLHGDMQDAPTVAALLKFKEIWKPHIRILGGDAFDFRPLRAKASKADQQEHIGEDVLAGKRFIEAFRPHHFMLGNHDARLWRTALEGDGLVQELAQHGVNDIERLCKRIGATIHPYDTRRGVLQIGALNFLHGFYVGETAAKRHALCFGPCLFGHCHTISTAPVPGLTRLVAQCVGALCQLRMDYNSQTPSALAQANGWAYGIISPSGDYRVWQAEQIDGKWVLPTDTEEL